MLRIVDVRSARLSVSELGEGMPVVFLHAGVTDRRSWEGTTSALAGSLHRYRLLSYDRRGFGDAAWEPASHSPVADLISVLDACDAAPAVLVGNSQGGRLAIDFALARPDLVTALVLVGTAVSGAPPPDETQPTRFNELSDLIDEAEEAGDLDLVNDLECQLWLDGPHGPAGRVRGDLRKQFLDMNGRALRAGDVGDAVWDSDSWSRLAGLDVTTTVVVGELDAPHIVERSRTIARRIRGASLISVAGVGHLVALEDPLGFANLLMSFLAGLEPTA